MKKLRILIDIDGIVADTMPYWLNRLNQKFGIAAKIKQITQYDLTKCQPLNQIKAREIFGILQNPGFTLGVPVMEGAGGVLKNLMNDGHEIYLVTARSGAQHISETFDWLKIHFPFIDTRKQLIFLYDKHLIPADVIIDDQAATLEKYKAQHPSALALGIEYPYNEYLDHAGSTVEATLVEYGDTAWMTLYQQITLHAESP